MSADVSFSPGGPFIGIDWGSTNARAMLFAAGGALLEEFEAPLGIKHVAPGGHRAAFDQLTASWRSRYGSIPAFLSGMIGSRHGWHEVPYLPCPTALTALRAALVPVTGVENVWLVPGLAQTAPHRDVMRGEELQLLGLGAEAKGFDWVCLPGTHSKWVRAEWPHVREFHTAMTGELFAAIGGHTLFANILPRVTAGDEAVFDERAFCEGVARSGAAHGLLHALFSIRADFLLGSARAEGVGELLSGLLIGTEIRHVLSSRKSETPVRVALLAATSIEQRYLMALRRLGLDATAFDAKQITAQGFVALAERSPASPGPARGHSPTP